MTVYFLFYTFYKFYIFIINYYKNIILKFINCIYVKKKLICGREKQKVKMGTKSWFFKNFKNFQNFTIYIKYILFDRTFYADSEYIFKIKKFLVFLYFFACLKFE